MLLAEIRGKRNDSIQRDEDYLTSAVFGHLRHVKAPIFWQRFFSRAISIVGRNLYDELSLRGFEFGPRCDFSISFWPFYPGVGEPDLLLRFVDRLGHEFVLIIEVKLFSQKSGTGDNDQLRRYFDLLQVQKAADPKREDRFIVGLIYLTHRFALDELQESVGLSTPEASQWMFTMQWQDLLEVAKACRGDDVMISEVADFLSKRGYEAFQGFTAPRSSDGSVIGGFYRSIYFRAPRTLAFEVTSSLNGRFYG